jgi:hypothetical protein
MTIETVSHLYVRVHTGIKCVSFSFHLCYVFFFFFLRGRDAIIGIVVVCPRNVEVRR